MLVPSWKLFAHHKIPYFDTPEKAVAAFSYLVDYQHNQELLLQVPEPLSPQPVPDIAAARSVIQSLLHQKRTILTGTESKAVLKAFAIPVIKTLESSTQEEAVIAAKELGFPVVMKILSPDISHKQDAGGVALNITNVKSVRQTFNQLIAHAKKACPTAKILGVSIEPMIKTTSDRELMIGVIKDIVFGPVINFGVGGSLVELLKDRALALPPLNQFIAKNLISQTRISNLLKAYRNMPEVDENLIINILLRVSELVCEFPAIQEMDVNPIIINEQGAIAVDARIRVTDGVSSSVPYTHMAIHPYSQQ